MKSSLLVTLADKKYIDQAKQLFSGAYFNAGWQGDYMLLAHDIPDKDLKWFLDKGILVKKCKGVFTDEEFEKLHNSWGSKYRPLGFVSIALSKFYLFTPEFKKWKNVVYLDLDIVVRASLEELARVRGFWAVNDMGWKLKRQFFDTNLQLFSELKKNYNLNKKSFNSRRHGFQFYNYRGRYIL